MMETQVNYAEILAFVASKTKGKKLENLQFYELPQKLELLSKYLGLTTMEVLLFVPVFDASCSNDTANVGDIAKFYDLSNLDILAHVMGIESLRKKSYIVDKEQSMIIKDLSQTEFEVDNSLLDALLFSKELPDLRTSQSPSYSQFDFVSAVVDTVIENSRSKAAIAHIVEKLERDYPQFNVVRKATELCPGVAERILYYIVCNNYDYSRPKDLDDTLSDFCCDALSSRKIKQAIIAGTSPLIKNDLVFIWKRRFDYCIEASAAGLEYFLQGEDTAPGFKPYGLDAFGFAKKVQEQIDLRDESDRPTTYLLNTVSSTEKYNHNLTLVQGAVEKIPEIRDRILFYSICSAYSRGASIDVRSLVGDVFDDQRDVLFYGTQFKTKSHILFKLRLVEMEEGSFFGGNSIVLSDEGKHLFLGEDYDKFEQEATPKDYKTPEEIKLKRLFYEPQFEIQLDLLRSSLVAERFKSLQKRLSEQALPTGVAALFYGSPGTGKTETVYQMAKATGRSVYQVDISEMKTCWYGESQKLVKEVFAKYKKQCKRSRLAPILLFNEADAVFGRRLDQVARSVDQTENAIQNIILEEMENLEGILVATTNLETNLDPAFERRFLFKLRFEKPSLASKTSIWRDKIPALSEESASELASAYDFSGGEIDNIARKLTMSKLLYEKEPSLDEIHTLCLNERLSTNNNETIGY